MGANASARSPSKVVWTGAMVFMRPPWAIWAIFVIALLLNWTFVATMASVVLSMPNCFRTWPCFRQSTVRPKMRLSSVVLKPAMNFPVTLSTTSPKALTTTRAATVQPSGMETAAVPSPPFMALAAAKSFPTVAPTPAPTLPSSTERPAFRHASYPISDVGLARQSPKPRSNIRTMSARAST